MHVKSKTFTQSGFSDVKACPVVEKSFITFLKWGSMKDQWPHKDTAVQIALVPLRASCYIIFTVSVETLCLRSPTGLETTLRGHACRVPQPLRSKSRCDASAGPQTGCGCSSAVCGCSWGQLELLKLTRQPSMYSLLLGNSIFHTDLGRGYVTEWEGRENQLNQQSEKASYTHRIQTPPRWVSLPAGLRKNWFSSLKLRWIKSNIFTSFKASNYHKLCCSVSILGNASFLMWPKNELVPFQDLLDEWSVPYARTF